MPILLGLMPILQQVLGSILPDPQAQQKAINDILAQVSKSDLAQLDVNKAEASNSSMFVAGWRPAVGWVCVAALAYQYIFLKVGIFAASFFSERATTALLNAPQMDNFMWELLLGMLGMAGLRSLDKIKGVAK